MLCHCSVEHKLKKWSAASLLSMFMCEFFQVQGNPSPCFLKSLSVLNKVKKIVMDNKMLQKSNTKRLGKSDCFGLFVIHKALNVVCISSLHNYLQIFLGSEDSIIRCPEKYPE